MIELLKYEWYNFKKSPTRKIACCLILLFFVSCVFVSNAVEARDLKNTTTSKLDEVMYYPEILTIVENELKFDQEFNQLNETEIRELETEYHNLDAVNTALIVLYSDYRHSIDGQFNIERYTDYLTAKTDALKAGVQLFGEGESIQKNELEIEVAMNHKLNDMPYFLSSYHLQSSNFISSVLTGVPVLLILVFVSLMNYEVFSSDFSGGSFKTTYTNEHSRRSIINSKLLFSIISTLIVIIIGIVIGMTITFLVNGFGSLHEETVVLSGYQSFIQPEVSYKIITFFERNIQAFIYFSFILVAFLMILHLIAVTSKSTSTTLSLSLAMILIIGIVGQQAISDKLSIILGLFSYDYNQFLYYPKFIGYYSPMLSNCFVSILIYLWMQLRFVKADL